jgi:hypothetical protein
MRGSHCVGGCCRTTTPRRYLDGWRGITSPLLEFFPQRLKALRAAEVLYYFSLADLDAVIARVKHSLVSDGVALLVHWLGPLDDPTSGDQAADHFIAGFSGETSQEERSTYFRIDLLRLGRD